MTTGSRVDFLLLAKSASGAACAQLIMQALGAPGVFVFGELLAMPHVQQYAAHLRLLEIFCYGQYQDYLAQSQSLPPLDDAQRKKLRQLSTVTLCQTHGKVLSYSLLSSSLQLDNIRMLEDLAIDAMYAEILNGRIDQKKQQLVIDCTIGRDVVSPHRLDQMIHVIQDWDQRMDRILSDMQQRIVDANAEAETERHAKEAFTQEFERACKAHKSTAEGDVPMRDAIDADTWMAMSRTRGARRHPPRGEREGRPTRR